MRIMIDWFLPEGRRLPKYYVGVYPEGYWSLRRVTGSNPNPNVVVDLRNKETLNSSSYARSKVIQKLGLVTIRTSEPSPIQFAA